MQIASLIGHYGDFGLRIDNRYRQPGKRRTQTNLTGSVRGDFSADHYSAEWTDGLTERTDRQTERQKNVDRQTHTQTLRHIHTETHADKHTEAQTHTDSRTQTLRQTQTRADSVLDKDRYTDIHKDTQTDTYTNRQTNTYT